MTTDAPAETPLPENKAARLRRRQDFVRASKTGARFSARLFALQMVRRDDAPASEAEEAVGPARFGFTVTRKVAGAVGRNRIRRRLKEALRTSGDLGARPGRDYVFVARQGALSAPFADIISQMAEGFARLDQRHASKPRRNQKDRPAAS